MVLIKEVVGGLRSFGVKKLFHLLSYLHIRDKLTQQTEFSLYAGDDDG